MKNKYVKISSSSDLEVGDVVQIDPNLSIKDPWVAHNMLMYAGRTMRVDKVTKDFGHIYLDGARSNIKSQENYWAWHYTTVLKRVQVREEKLTIISYTFMDKVIKDDLTMPAIEHSLAHELYGKYRITPVSNIADQNLIDNYKFVRDHSHRFDTKRLYGRTYKSTKRVLRKELKKRNLWPVV